MLSAAAAGHVNERNFVGLSVTADGYLACGSEDNAVYTYHAGLPAPLAHHRFAAADASLGAVRRPPARVWGCCAVHVMVACC